MQPGMNTSKAHYYTSRLLDQNPEGKQVRRSTTSPPPDPWWMLQFSSSWPPEIISEVWWFSLAQSYPLTVYWDISLNLLGAVAVVLIAGSHTIQQWNVNPVLCCSWTETQSKVFMNLFLFFILFQIALEQSVYNKGMQIILPMLQMCLLYVSLTRRHNSTVQFGSYS